MEKLETQHHQTYKKIFDYNYKTTLSFFGQWPTQSFFRRNIIRSLIFLNVLSIFTPKVIKFCESTNDVDVFFECIPMLGLHLLSLSKLITWSINFEKTKTLLDFMNHDRRHLRLERDLKIMQDRINRDKVITAAYSTAMFSILILYLASPAVPKILDMIKPLNTSRNLIFLYQTEYFVDQHQYYIPILLHAYLTVPFSVSIIVFFDNVLAMYVTHARGMFSILRSYLERLHLDTNNKPYTDKNKDLIHKNIIQCVQMHRRILEFADIMESLYSYEYIFLLILNLFVITLTGIVAVIKLDQINECLKYCAFCIGGIFHLLYCSYQGQELIEESERIFTAAYSSEWYTFPPWLQKLLIPIMMRSVNPSEITAGKLVPISMDTFSIVLKNSMSFFTVLSSMR
ncbi:odorant receptor 4-like [Chelonus insularis]|uniref:odorant receptor 4-like n=1 Tax=Chelonus insularis TaxID=460826 RepID=UPI00158A0B9C|nr:odorant receptor 4-like [Chelonus insularis]